MPYNNPLERSSLGLSRVLQDDSQAPTPARRLTGALISPSIQHQKQLLHRHLPRHQTLIKGIANESFQIRAILF